MLTFAKGLSSSFLDFLYPPACIACNRLLPDSRQKICPDCWKAIPRVTKSLPLYQQTCAKLREAGAISDLVSCFIFEKDGPFQHIAHALKYKEYQSLGTDLGKHIGETLRDWNLDVDLLIPVPLHRIKHRERGYNQSECIARGIASVTGTQVVLTALRRTRYTQTQTKLNIEERRKNMERAFELIPHSAHILSGKNCLIIDDVITTGATICACAEVLRTAGAARILAASAALAE